MVLSPHLKFCKELQTLWFHLSPLALAYICMYPHIYYFYCYISSFISNHPSGIILSNIRNTFYFSTDKFCVVFFFFFLYQQSFFFRPEDIFTESNYILGLLFFHFLSFSLLFLRIQPHFFKEYLNISKVVFNISPFHYLFAVFKTILK